MDPKTSTVQQVPKSSSDQLLRKFAELDSDPIENSRSSTKLEIVRGSVRRKRAPKRALFTVASTTDIGSAGKKSRLKEVKALLPGPTRRPRSLLRRVGVVWGPGGRLREVSSVGFMFQGLEKTWRKTIEGASKLLVERHCHSHVQLISDVV